MSDKKQQQLYLGTATKQQHGPYMVATKTSEKVYDKRAVFELKTFLRGREVTFIIIVFFAIMIKITAIESIDPYFLICRFSNNTVKKLDVYPLIQNHKRLEGIEKLLDVETFKKARIGEMGEIVWDKIIKTTYHGEELIWDYDISPEFAFEHAI